MKKTLISIVFLIALGVLAVAQSTGGTIGVHSGTLVSSGGGSGTIVSMASIAGHGSLGGGSASLDYTAAPICDDSQSTTQGAKSGTNAGCNAYWAASGNIGANCPEGKTPKPTYCSVGAYDQGVCGFMTWGFVCTCHYTCS